MPEFVNVQGKMM